ncbi:NmrA domain-containing protein [Mycena kentingensis (nom. inval.)]|nr:NmrA domain-containing protein [Mycena kentingensis (nom. inval.)]
MSAYKSFALIGAGTLGGPILSELASKGVSVVLLTRLGSKKDGLPAGVKVVSVDFNDVAEVTQALKANGVEVVLSTVATEAVSAQKPLVEAAKAAGIKLMVPSEYGMPTDGQTEGVLGAKNEIAEFIKSAGIPSLRIYIGGFAEFVPWLFAIEDKKIHIVGKGEAPVTITAIADIAGFVAHVLTTLPASELENKIFRIQGDRLKAQDIGPLFGASTVYVDTVPGELGELKTGLQRAFNSGAGSTGWNAATQSEGTGDAAAGSANKYWPGHQWKTVKDVHGL